MSTPAVRQFTNALTVLASVALSSMAAATTAQNIRPATINPLAVRGGVLMVPLVAGQPGANWPQSLRLMFENGRVVDGMVAWLQPDPPPSTRNWTDEPRHISVRRVQPDDDSSRPQAGSPILLARIPDDGSGTITIAGHTVAPIWLNAVAPPQIVDPELRRLPIRTADDLPDPKSPLEHWRWIVMADALSMSAPDTQRFDELQSMLAEHQATLWRIGLNRLRNIDQRLAERCTMMLISTGYDRDVRFGTWVSDAVELDALLRVLLQSNRSHAMITAEVESWIESQRPVLMWPVALYGESVELALVNRLDRVVTIDLHWQDSVAPPEQFRLVPGVLSRLMLQRPQSAARGLGLPVLDEPAPVVLQVTAGRLAVGSLTFPPAELIAKPPGVFVTALFPALTLADVERVRQPPVDPSHATTVHVRRLSRRWEIFVECRRPSESSGSRPPAIGIVNTLDELRGIEAITLLIGRDAMSNEPPIVLAIPELGWWRLLRGRQDGALQIHRRSFNDRWYCRVVLPDIWIQSHLDDDILLLGLVRTHHDHQSMETAPNRCVPWRIQQGQLRIDLSRWDDLPRFERRSIDAKSE